MKLPPPPVVCVLLCIAAGALAAVYAPWPLDFMGAFVVVAATLLPLLTTVTDVAHDTREHGGEGFGRRVRGPR